MRGIATFATLRTVVQSKISVARSDERPGQMLSYIALSFGRQREPPLIIAIRGWSLFLIRQALRPTEYWPTNARGITPRGTWPHVSIITAASRPVFQ